MSRPVKRSLSLQGHATSVSLEPEFWAALQGIAMARGLSVSALVAEIDAARRDGTGLATALRLHVLADLQRRLAAAQPLAGPAGGIE